MAYTNSPLVVYTDLSPNHSGQRIHAIDRITPHCVVGQLSAETICACFPAGRDASCNYGIGTDGRVSLCVEEKNRSWCTSSNANDQRAITIECASDKTEPYTMNSAVYATLIKLCTDICQRNGKSQLGAYKILDNAKAKVDANPGYAVFDENGKAIYGGSAAAGFSPYLVNVFIEDLNIRKGPGTNYGTVGKFTGKGCFTIVEEASGQGASMWGLLKSYADGHDGWISLDFATRI